MNIEEHMNKSLEECPSWIIASAVKYLKETIPEETVEEIRGMWDKDNSTWWAMIHHGWGTSVRNLLRDNVCTDAKLPSGNWDDYYIQMVEVACGLRNM